MEDKLNDLKAKQEIAFRKKANVLEEKARLVEKNYKQLREMNI